MALKVVPNIPFPATATINLNGFKASFGITCKLLHAEEIKDLEIKWSGVAAVYADPISDKFKGVPPITPAVLPVMTDREFIDQWLIGFDKDVTGPDDQPLEFTPANLTQVLNMPGAARAVIKAFFKGYEEAETKNSVTPVAG